MHNYKWKHPAVLIMVFVIINFPFNTFCYDDKKTHPNLTREGSRTSKLNNYLQNNLSIEEGLDKVLRNSITGEVKTILRTRGTSIKL